MADPIFNGADSDWLAITQNAFKDGRDYFNAGPRLELEHDVRQFQGMHPLNSKYLAESYRARSRFFRPKTRATIRRNEAVAASALFSNYDVVEIGAWDESSKVQVASASLNKELMNLRLTRSLPWFQIAIGGYQEAQANGIVVAHSYWRKDPLKGIDQPWIDLVPIENFVFSPSSSWFDPVNSSPYVIEMIPMLVKDVKGRIVRDSGKSEGGRWLPLEDAQILQGVRGYSDSIRLQRENRRTDPQAQMSSLTPYQTVWVFRNIADVDGVDYLWYTLGESQLLSRAQRLTDVYWHGRRPYTLGYAVLEAHKLYPPGIPRLTRDLQGELNENANARADNVKFAMQKRYFAKRGAQVDVRSLTRNVPGSVTLMNDPKEDVIVQETHDVTQSAYEEQDRLNMDFDELAGSNSKASRGDPQNLANKVGGAEMLAEDANQIEGYQLRTYVETFVQPLLQQVLLLEQHYETDEGILTLCGKKAALDEQGIEVIDENLLMQELSLNVHVGIGSTSPRMQLDNLLWGFARIRELLETPTLTQYGLDVEEMMNEIFGKLGYRTADRFFKWNDQDPQIQALNSQVEQLTSMLKNKQDPPEIVAGKVDLLRAQVKKTLNEAFNVNVEGLFGALQAGEVVAAVPTVAPVGDAIARDAGYQPPVPAGQSPGIQSGDGGIGPAAGGAAGAGGMDGDEGGAPPAPAAGLTIDPKGVVNHKTGIGFQPGAANGAAGGVALPPGVPHNTDPLHPALPAKPASPDVGVNAGIEGGRPSAHPGKPLAGGPPPAAPVDETAKEERAHQRAMQMEEHKAKLKAKYGGERADEQYTRKKQEAKQAEADKARREKEQQDAAAARDKSEAKADERHAQTLEALKHIAGGQQKIAEHLAKHHKPGSVAVKRDAKGNIVALEPKD